MKVLVATDSSECSQAAIETALNMKFSPGSELHVIMVEDFFEPLPALEGVKEKEIESARKYIATTIENMQTALPQVKVTGALLDGYADQKIISAAEEFKANLIVIGSHGRSGMTRFLLGSISRSVLMGAPCAVRIVRKFADQQENNNVVVALDHSAHSEHALEHILESAWPDQTKFKCITVLAAEHHYMNVDPERVSVVTLRQEELRLEAAAALASAVARINSALVAGCASYEVLEGDPREQILAFAGQWPATLIVMGSHGRNLMERVFLGSVSDAVVTHAHCSVEVTRVPSKKPAKMHIII
jgi:nucleotide-binding universal stress UspA family protein